MTEPVVQLVRLEVSSGIATLTLNDPVRLNALGAELTGQALSAVQQVRDDTSARVLVLCAAGRAFCVGANLAELRSARAALQDDRAVGEAIGDLMGRTGNPLVLALRTLPVPVLCAVRGPVAGGGVGLALAGDIVIAARSAFFSLPFVPALGLVPDMGAAWFMQRAIGTPRTAALSLLGDRLSAEQAAQCGLIWACVDDAHLEEETRRLAVRLAHGPAHGITELRALLAEAERRDLPAQLDYERERQSVLAGRPTFAEGVAAFLGKRPPVFPGRGA